MASEPVQPRAKARLLGGAASLTIGLRSHFGEGGGDRVAVWAVELVQQVSYVLDRELSICRHGCPSASTLDGAPEKSKTALTEQPLPGPFCVTPRFAVEKRSVLRGVERAGGRDHMGPPGGTVREKAIKVAALATADLSADSSTAITKMCPPRTAPSEPLILEKSSLDKSSQVKSFHRN